MSDNYEHQARTLIDTWRDEWHLEPEPEMNNANSRIYESLVNHVATTLQSQLEQLRAENQWLNEAANPTLQLQALAEFVIHNHLCAAPFNVAGKQSPKANEIAVALAHAKTLNAETETVFTDSQGTWYGARLDNHPTTGAFEVCPTCLQVNAHEDECPEGYGPLPAAATAAPQTNNCPKCGGSGEIEIGCAMDHALTAPCVECGGSGHATAAPVEQSDEKIETHLGVLPFSLIDEIHERRQTIYRGIDYRVSPDVAAKLKTDLDYLMAFAVALRSECTTHKG